jgi:hypothetical protein
VGWHDQGHRLKLTSSRSSTAPRPTSLSWRKMEAWDGLGRSVGECGRAEQLSWGQCCYIAADERIRACG